MDPLAAGIAAVAVLLGLAGLAFAGLDRRPGKPLLQGILLLQLLLLAQAAIAITRLLQGERPDDVGAFVGYLIVSALLVPGGAIWSLEERSRYGTLILAAVCLVVAVLERRLVGLWSTLE